jgi:hypothetical protein
MEPKGGGVTRPRWGGAQMELRVVNESSVADNVAGEHGGGIASWVLPAGAWAAQVDVNSSRITGNRSLEGDGGGVYGWFAGSSVAVTRSTIDGNEAGAGRGGGLAVGEGAVLDLGRSTVSHNLADGIEYPAGSGGGIEIVAAEATIMNSTISGNQALRGAGIDIAADASDNRKLHGDSGELGASVEVDDCTIVDNTAQALGGGVAVVAVPGFGPAELRIVGSILGYNADRRGSGNCSSAMPAVLISDGHNVADDTTCWLMSAPDGGVGGPLAAEDLVVADVMLGPLTLDNGGTTATHMPLDGSPVIDVGAGGGQRCHGDQRDRPRDVDMGATTDGCKCDAGAVEAGSQAMPILRGRDSSGRDN